MKKRKKRRSKTEGGDKLPFDDEMGKNQKAVKVINKIFEAGITEEKDISAMTLDEILEIQGITVAEIGMINDLQKAIKANKVITFLGGGEL